MKYDLNSSVERFLESLFRKILPSICFLCSLYPEKQTQGNASITSNEKLCPARKNRFKSEQGKNNTRHSYLKTSAACLPHILSHPIISLEENLPIFFEAFFSSFEGAASLHQQYQT